jgi:hypothetical protein
MVVMKSSASRIKRCIVSLKSNDVSEEYVASNLRAEE